MANLMLTKQCNLHCSYCFANEFVNRQNDVMSLENFMTCLRFLSNDPRERIGLIGGEPTMHPEFKRILVELINGPFNSVCLFTNGILVDNFFNELRNSKFSILINLNSPQSIGQSWYSRILDNANEMINHLYMRDQVQFSLNVHSPDMEFDYILEALKLFGQKRLRLSIAIPNMEEGRDIDPLDYFHIMGDTVRHLVKKLIEEDIAPNFDCNYIPSCMLTDEDRTLLSKYSTTMARSNILKINPICSPVLDILPDLKVVRCFGMSGFYKANLLDFKNTEDLRRHFEWEIDSWAYHLLPSPKCKGCGEYAAIRCSAGCYAYRSSRMRKLKEITENAFGGLR